MKTIHLHTFPTPIGDMVAATTEDGLAMLEFVDRFTMERNRRVLEKRFGPCSFVEGPPPAALQSWVEDYFAARFRALPLSLDAGGTPFQRAVWDRLAAIPSGRTQSYQAIASDLGRPLAVRAVARANGQNPLAIVVPCHRVIGSDGSLTGYGGGLWRKRWLLEHEACPKSGNGHL